MLSIPAMKYLFVTIAFIGWFFSIGLILRDAGKTTSSFTQGTVHLVHAKNEAALPAPSLLFLNGGNSPAAAQYIQSLQSDFAGLRTAVQAKEALLAAKNAKQFLCSLSGFADWSRRHRLQNGLPERLDTMVAYVRHISNTVNAQQQAAVFEKLCTYISQRNKVRRSRNSLNYSLVNDHNK